MLSQHMLPSVGFKRKCSGGLLGLQAGGQAGRLHSVFWRHPTAAARAAGARCIAAGAARCRASL